ncbi:MAG: hypothetical protein GW772_11485 [Flavobacteriia bacterium]|nr:hypothetical protein [Flavobacteriia bacterium]
MEKTLDYKLVLEFTLISLFCQDLLSGDFSNIDNYDKQYENINRKIFDYKNKNL